MIRLSQRLAEIARLVQGCGVLADVGCDHGKLSIYCLQTQQVRFAYLMDLRSGPLKEAARNVQFYQLSDRAKIIQSDGLKELQDDFDCLIISGMGSELILKIIEISFDKVKRAKRIILQANKNMALVRNKMAELNFKIIDETMVFDRKYYEISVFESCAEKVCYTEEEILFGPVQLQKRSKAFIDFLVQEKSTLEKLKCFNNEKILKRLNVLQKILEREK